MKPKTCKSCKQEYTPIKQAQPRCIPCIQKEEKDKVFKQLKKQIEKPLKPQKPLKQKIDKEWIKLSKAIKKRDAGLPCISCGKYMQPYEIQAGHYIARGKSTKLKYEPRNIHAQCWNCNNNHQIQQQVQEGFRKGLIARKGLAEVEWLEGSK
jgi:hypothetical protein